MYIMGNVQRKRKRETPREGTSPQTAETVIDYYSLRDVQPPLELETLIDLIEKTMKANGTRKGYPAEPSPNGLIRSPLPYFRLGNPVWLPQFLHHIGDETWKTLNFILAGINSSAQDVYITIFGQSSGSGKTHALYWLGTHPETNALVILCNTVMKETYGEHYKNRISLNQPWTFVSARLRDLESLLGEDPSEARKLMVSDAAYATLQLLLAGYVEFTAELLEGFKDRGFGAHEMRIAAMWALRNRTGENEVRKIVNARLNTESSGCLTEKIVDGQRFVIPDREKVDVVFGSAVTKLDALIPDVKIILGIDEVQALEKHGEDLFLHFPKYDRGGNTSPMPGAMAGANVTEEGREARDNTETSLPRDAIYGLNAVCSRLLSQHRVGSVFVGTKSTFTQLKKTARVSATHCRIEERQNVDVFSSDSIRALVLYYFNVEEAWDARLRDPEFKTKVYQLQGRGLWTAHLIHVLGWELGRLSHSEDSFQARINDALTYAVRATLDLQKTRIPFMIGNAFDSLKLVGKGNISLSTAMLTLYATIELDAEKSLLSEDLIDTLIINSSVAVHNKQALLSMEPVVRQSIVDAAKKRLNGDLKDYFRRKLNEVIMNIISGSLLISHSGLGECVEPLLCHSLLLARPRFGQFNLWDVLRHLLGYISEYAEGNDPELKEKAQTIIETLQDIDCNIRVCKNLSHITTSKSEGTEFKFLFNKFPPPSGDYVNLECIGCLLSQSAGVDMCFLTLHGLHFGSVFIQSKITLNGSFSDAAKTTDPQLQFLTDTQRLQAISGQPVENPSKSRLEYDNMRACLKTKDPFKRCHRFVAALAFQSSTKEEAIRRYGESDCPLLPLDIGQGIPFTSEMKMKLSKNQGGEPQPLRHMHGGSVLWKGVPCVSYRYTD